MTTTHAPSTRYTSTLRRAHWSTLTALTLLLGCGAHDADIAAPSIADEGVAPSDSFVDRAVPGDEAPLLGMTDTPLSTAEEGGEGPVESAALVPTTNHRSGERIQGRFLSTSDGLMTWQGWRDNERAEECSFQLDDQGTMRCFPVNGTEQLYYSNAECTRAFVSNEPTAQQTPPNYYFYRKDTACGTGIRAYEIATSNEELSTVYVLNAQRECVSVDASGRTFRALAAPIDPTSFVAAEYGVIESSSRVKGYGLLAEDGAVQVTGFVDDTLDATCMWTGTQTATCLPLGQTIDRFADPEMSIPLMKAAAGSCSEDATTMGVRFGGAGTARYYRRGEPFDGSTVYGVIPQIVNGPAAISVVEPYYRVEEISVDRFARASVHSNVTSRLNPVYWNAEDGNTWFSHWYDLALGSSCTFTSDTDDQALCLPDATGSRIVYTDAACGQPVAEIDANCGNERPQFAMEHLSTESHRSRINVRRLMAVAPVQSVYEATDAGCVLRAARGDKQYFDLSEPLPAQAFVSASGTAAEGAIPSNDDRLTVGSAAINPVR